MTDLVISEIAVEPIANQNGLIGFANFVINDAFKVQNVGIYTCQSSDTKIRLTFPVKEYKGLRIDIVKPINQASYEAVVAAVASAYRDLMEKLR